MRYESQPKPEAEQRVYGLQSQIVANLQELGDDASPGYNKAYIANNHKEGDERTSLVLHANGRWSLDRKDDSLPLGKLTFNGILREYASISDPGFQPIKDVILANPGN